MASQCTIKCSMCDNQTDNPQVFFRHIVEYHRSTNPFYILCSVDQCTDRLFSLYSTYRRHWYLCHHKNPRQNSPVRENELVDVILNSETDSGENARMLLCARENAAVELQLANEDEELSMSDANVTRLNTPTHIYTAGFLLALKHQYFLSFETLAFVQRNIDKICEMWVKHLEEKLAFLVPSSTKTKPKYQRAIAEIAAPIYLTRHKMERCWAKNFPTTLPMCVSLSSCFPQYHWKRNADGTLKIGHNQDQVYIIPFLKSLQQLLSVKSVYDSTLKSFERIKLNRNTSGVYSDVWDGSYIKTHELFIRLNGVVLGFQFYWDEVEPANPLGSKKGDHKVGVFYWSLMNLPPNSRSSLRSIQLLGVVNSCLLKQHGMIEFLRPVLKDLADLQMGVKLCIRGQEREWFGFLTNCVGDMPASNKMAGFKESVSCAQSPCRMCHIQREQMDLIHHENDCRLRDIASYKNQVKEIEEAENVKDIDELSKAHGINGQSCFSSLAGFDATKAFPSDYMHLADEGFLNLELKLLLRFLIAENRIDLAQVNIDLSLLKSHRQFTPPPEIKYDEVMGDGKLSFSASEMSSLLIMIALVLAEYVTCDESPQYANYVLLLRICASLQCYTFTEDQLKLTQLDIECHNSAFVLLYPKISGYSITPKLHYIIHFISQIRLHGPPRYSSCYRYESKNAPLKKVVRRICNFKNVEFSLAFNHQQLLGLAMQSDGEADFFCGGKYFEFLVFYKYKKKTVQGCQWSLLIPPAVKSRNEFVISSVKTLKVSGRLCKKGSVFLKEIENSMPVFWRISNVLVLDNDTVFIFENLTTLFFSDDHFSFVVRPSETFCAISQFSSLLFHCPLQSFVLRNNIHVIPNYYHML